MIKTSPMHDLDIAPLINRVARGKNGAENLNRTEAAFVFSALLRYDADPLQLGAFLIAQRMKGETSEELAGFVDAAREHIGDYGRIKAPEGSVDMPCYAGKRRAAPVHIAAALKARDAGIPVLVHGVSHIQGRSSAWQALERAGVQHAMTLDKASQLLHSDGIAYLDLADMCTPLNTIFHLRPRLGVRTFANTVARLLNPLQCTGQINGFFHTPYADYMANANILLGQQRSLIFMGAEGDPELYADRQKVTLWQSGPQLTSLRIPEAGLPPYPKETVEDNKQLLVRFEAVLQGEADAREAAVLARMGEAFRLMSSGTFPDNWQRED